MSPKRALIVVDVQNDFCEGGSLEVPNSQMVVKQINSINKETFDLVFYTKDFHVADHVSFAANHPGKNPFTNITLLNGKVQELWPIHCVQNTPGSELQKDLVVSQNSKIIFKGVYQDIESYSGFGSEGEDTGLLAQLREGEIDEVYVCGLAYDFCVGSTAIDSAKNQFKTFIILDAVGSISPPKVASMNERFKQFGKYINLINSNQIPNAL